MLKQTIVYNTSESMHVDQNDTTRLIVSSNCSLQNFGYVFSWSKYLGHNISGTAYNYTNRKI